MDKKEKRAENFYRSFLAYTESLFALYTTNKQLDFQSILKMIIRAWEFVRLDRNHIVHVMQTAERYKNPHVSHSVRSSIIALIIGTYLKLPRHQLIELGVANLLCNISVVKLSGRIYATRNDGIDLLTLVTDREKKLLNSHSIDACESLKSLKFPLSICEAVLQHHELEDGSGFPRRLKGSDIGIYAKIIAVAGFYEAFSSEHIEGAKCGHSGIIKILQNNGSFDVSVIRALVNSISIYPVGIYVLLSNGERGQVVDIVQENPRFPVVEIFREQFFKETVSTSDELSIARPLTSEEVVRMALAMT
jgi:HD-GYP domain-containing protein (c-di-GMP phosphodiesterase class II)